MRRSETRKMNYRSPVARDNPAIPLVFGKYVPDTRSFKDEATVPTFVPALRPGSFPHYTSRILLVFSICIGARSRSPYTSRILLVFSICIGARSPSTYTSRILLLFSIRTRA